MAERKNSVSKHEQARAALRKSAEIDELLRQSIQLGDTEYVAGIPLEGNFISQLGIEDTQRRADKKGPLGLSEYIHHIMRTNTGEIINPVPEERLYGTGVRGRYFPTENPPHVAGHMYINTTDIADKFGPTTLTGRLAKDQAALEAPLSGNPVVAHELGHTGLNALRYSHPDLIAKGRKLKLSEEDILEVIDAQKNYIGKKFPERLLSGVKNKAARINLVDEAMNPTNIRMAKALASGSENKGVWGSFISLFKEASEKRKKGEKLSSREQAIVDYIRRLQKAARAEQLRKRAKSWQ